MAIPIEDLEAVRNGLGAALSEALPEGVGFTLILFDFGKGGNITYLSNAQREDMEQTLADLLKKWKKQRKKAGMRFS